MLGGGTFTKQDKVLPGSYINFVSLAKAASMLSERGYAALPMVMDWGFPGKYLPLAGNIWKRTVKRFSDMSIKMKG